MATTNPGGVIKTNIHFHEVNPLEKLELLTDRMMDIDTPFLWRDEEDRLCVSNQDERKAQAHYNRVFIESVKERIESKEWEEALELLNTELYELISKTKEYLWED